jgi:hypothetical protein
MSIVDELKDNDDGDKETIAILGSISGSLLQCNDLSL